MTEPAADLDAERAVLGAMLLAPRVIRDVQLEPADFHHPAHEAIYAAISSMAAAGRPVDAITLKDALHETGELSRVGGPGYLIDLVQSPPTAANVGYYATIVREKAIRRRIAEAGRRITQRAETVEALDTLVNDARRDLDNAARLDNDDAGISAADLVTETIDALDGDADPGISTGWPDLDTFVNGLRPGQLVIVGARPSVGKSVIAANVAASVCAAGAGVHFASLEMTRREVMNRLLSAHASVDLSRLMNHKLDEADWSRIAPRSQEIARWPLRVDDTQSQSLAQLRARARTTARRFDLGVIVVDYLQLMAPRDRGVPREQQVGELSEGLKGLAKELGVPVVALAQVNRASADRTNKRPMLSDLRESGRIEADADHVWLLHREDLVNPNSATGEIEVLVAKNRNGISGGAVTLMFQGHYSRAVQRAWKPALV